MIYIFTNVTPHSLFASEIINNLRFYANMFLPVIILLHRNVVVCTGLATHLCMWLWWYMSLACAEKRHLYLAGVQTLSVGRWHWVNTLEILLVSVGVYRHMCLFSLRRRDMKVSLCTMRWNKRGWYCSTNIVGMRSNLSLISWTK